MGKGKRRLRSPKYAKKYATLRDAVARARALIDEAIADGVITEEEAEEIAASQDSVLVATDEMMEFEVGEGIQVASDIRMLAKETPPKPKKKTTAKKKKKTTTKKKGTDA